MQKGLAKKQPSPHWIKKFFKLESMGPELPLNREGFWKKHELEEIEIELIDEHKRQGMEKSGRQKLR